MGLLLDAPADVEAGVEEGTVAALPALLLLLATAGAAPVEGAPVTVDANPVGGCMRAAISLMRASSSGDMLLIIWAA
jgi:hypothetical protein